MTTSSKSKQSNAAQEAHAVLTNVATARSFAPSVRRQQRRNWNAPQSEGYLAVFDTPNA